MITRPKKKYGDKNYYVRTVTVRLMVPPRWVWVVYNRGRAVIDGHLIMDIIGESDRGTLVVAARQCARLGVLPQFAYLRRNRLHWAYPHPPTPPHDTDRSGLDTIDVFAATLLVPHLPEDDRARIIGLISARESLTIHEQEAPF